MAVLMVIDPDDGGGMVDLIERFEAMQVFPNRIARVLFLALREPKHRLDRA